MKNNYRKYRFLIHPKPLWTEIIRSKEDPEYEIDDVF